MTPSLHMPIPKLSACLRIAMLAPPWIEVPPPGYGGVENVVALLCEAVVRHGHSVTLFAAPGSRSSATVRAMLDRPHPGDIGKSLYEADHVARALADIDLAARGRLPFDVIHDHSGFTALAMANRIATPMVHTIHGPFADDTRAFYSHHAHKAAMVALSRCQLAHAPEALMDAVVIPNPVAVEDWPFRSRKHDYLLWMGRIDADKGPHRAIDAARLAGRRLVLAGPVQPGHEEYFRTQIRPQIDGRRVSYVGEVGGSPRQELFAGAAALLMPIRWPEPFGLVMVEALACGTPVISFPEGAANDIVLDGENGFMVDDEVEMAHAVGRLDQIDARRCRTSVRSRFDVDQVARRYESVYLRSAGRLERRGEPLEAAFAAAKD